VSEWLKILRIIRKRGAIDSFDIDTPEDDIQVLIESQLGAFLQTNPEYMSSVKIALASAEKKDREVKDISRARLTGDYKLLCDEIVKLKDQIERNTAEIASLKEESIHSIQENNSMELIMRNNLINSLYNFVKNSISKIPIVKYVFVLENEDFLTFTFIVSRDTFLKATEDLSVILVDLLRIFKGIGIDFATFEEQQVDLDYLKKNNNLIYSFGDE